ncbi:MAG: biotin--[acetyl-CoA-carboxylase] ligase [Eubacteriales bacterium]|nr:biotin--[acetyl-CoA-carboxylase] ligase [Eubacteriales bacterium]MDY3332650.1 biotin--[acetyl-CoA-carboxylase] ligase [Gallibacter sp.]
MGTKNNILKLFEENRGQYFSGENIAQQFDVSRTAVWKAVKSLQKEGYPISAITNKGYCLLECTDILSKQGINKYLDNKLKELEIEVLSSTTSTNDILKEKASEGLRDGYVLIANEQTKGRGRLRRNFYSPNNTGVYMSLLLRPRNYTSEDALSITTMAAVAMCEAIESVSDEKAEIKWVNDIFVRGKKVGGILTEGSFELETGLLDYAVLGIGVNLYEPVNGFAEELKEIAGSIFLNNENDVKNKLVAEFLNRFYKYYHANMQNNSNDYVEEYRKRSFVIGKKVRLISGNESKNALVLGIDDSCHLIVRYEDEREECCYSGEISLRF